MLVLRRRVPILATPGAVTVVTSCRAEPSVARRRSLHHRRDHPALMAFGPAAAVTAILVSLATGAGAWSPTVPGWSAVLALCALVAGIPHGAVDHLTTAPHAPLPRARWAVRYVALAVAAVAVILLAPVQSFLVVVAMSVWHFGSGDVEARLDLSPRATADPGRWGRVLGAVAAGSAPLILPLTSPAAVAAVNQVDPHLAVLWSPGVAWLLRLAVLVVVAVAIVSSLRRRDRRGALELAVLCALGLVATPLLAFATYFSCWHALRHTARLAQPTPGADVTGRGLLVVLRAGLPALVVTVAAIAGVAALPGRSSLLGAGLAVVWGLTVPHLLAVARFDRRRRQARDGAPLAAPTAA